MFSIFDLNKYFAYKKATIHEAGSCPCNQYLLTYFSIFYKLLNQRCDPILWTHFPSKVNWKSWCVFTGNTPGRDATRVGVHASRTRVSKHKHTTDRASESKQNVRKHLREPNLLPSNSDIFPKRRHQLLNVQNNIN